MRSLGLRRSEDWGGGEQGSWEHKSNQDEDIQYKRKGGREQVEEEVNMHI